MTTQHEERVVPPLTLGWRLRMARSMTGLGVREFAQEIGVSHGTITSAELDQRAVRPITIKMWSMRSGVDLEWLETGRTSEDGGNGTTTPDGGSSADMPSSSSSQAPPTSLYAASIRLADAA